MIWMDNLIIDEKIVLEATGTYFYRTMPRIARTEYVSNNEVWEKMEIKIALILNTRKRQWKFLSHRMRNEALENYHSQNILKAKRETAYKLLNLLL